MAEDFTCPCCDNPWARATGDVFAKICAECSDKDKKAADGATFGVSLENMDLDVEPKDNFFLYANGGWMKKNPIPAGYPSWNTFLSLHVNSQEQCKELFEELTTKKQMTDEESKVAVFYAAAMDEERIERVGTSPLEPVLKLIEKIKESFEGSKSSQTGQSEYARLLGELSSNYGIDVLFSIGPSPDYQDSSHSLCNISQGGLGLPDRDYYFDDDKKDKREAYVMHVAKMLAMLDDPSVDSCTEITTAAARAILDFETRLADAHMTKTENRDPQATNNKMTVVDLTERGKNAFDFPSYFIGSTGMSQEELGYINVRNTAALERMAETVAAVDPETLVSYLKWHSVLSCAPFLSKAFVDENFRFYEKTLSGTQEIKPRWKRAMAFTEKALGEVVGKLYCSRYFDEECKSRAESIVESVRKALEARLREVDWIKSGTTREQALAKMSKFRVKIGYPDKWIDYTPLVFDEDEEFLGMIFKSWAFKHKRAVKEMNSPTDREKWFMTPQTVNAYYHPSLNEIVFPAAILQHPFFDRNADDAVNYGAMGAVVAHEMTHAYDDKGRKFNHAGVLQDWWTEEDAAEYERRVEVMVSQANAFEVYGKTVQGKLTSGENIADLGGVRLALRALKSQDSFDPEDKIDGLNSLQRFFLSWAQCWRQNITEERALQLLTLDPHGPNELRCNGPLSNIPDFHEAFKIPEGSPMFKPRENRVDIW